MTLLDKGEVLSVFSLFATRLRQCIQLFEGHKCNATAFQQLLLRLNRVVEFCFGNDGIMFLSTAVDNALLSIYNARLVNILQNSIQELAVYCDVGFLNYLLDDSNIQDSFDTLNIQLTDCFNDLCSLLNVMSVEPPQKINVVCNVQSRINTSGGFHVLLYAPYALDEWATIIGCSKLDLKSEINDLLVSYVDPKYSANELPSRDYFLGRWVNERGLSQTIRAGATESDAIGFFASGYYSATATCKFDSNLGILNVDLFRLNDITKMDTVQYGTYTRLEKGFLWDCVGTDGRADLAKNFTESLLFFRLPD